SVGEVAASAAAPSTYRRLAYSFALAASVGMAATIAAIVVLRREPTTPAEPVAAATAGPSPPAMSPEPSPRRRPKIQVRQLPGSLAAPTGPATSAAPKPGESIRAVTSATPISVDPGATHGSQTSATPISVDPGATRGSQASGDAITALLSAAADLGWLD